MPASNKRVALVEPPAPVQAPVPVTAADATPSSSASVRTADPKNPAAWTRFSPDH